MTSPPAVLNMVSVQRLTVAILVIAYLALGSGAVERWHNAQHAAADARALAAARESGAPPARLLQLCSPSTPSPSNGLGTATT